jgi:hypothetical protein
LLRRIHNLHLGIFRKIRSQEGGAIVEFVALALPLFIPIFIYLNQYAAVSDTEATLRTLAREMSRAIVTSENDVVAHSVAEEVFIKGGLALGLANEIESGQIRYFIHCREQPCISPDNEIEVSISAQALDMPISTVSYVSPWA